MSISGQVFVDALLPPSLAGPTGHVRVPGGDPEQDGQETDPLPERVHDVHVLQDHGGEAAGEAAGQLHRYLREDGWRDTYPGCKRERESERERDGWREREREGERERQPVSFTDIFGRMVGETLIPDVREGRERERESERGGMDGGRKREREGERGERETVSFTDIFGRMVGETLIPDVREGREGVRDREIET